MDIDKRIKDVKQFLDEQLARENQALRAFVEYELSQGTVFDDYVHLCREASLCYHHLVRPSLSGRLYLPGDSATAAEKMEWEQTLGLRVPVVFKIMAFDCRLYPELYVAYISSVDGRSGQLATYCDALFIAALELRYNDCAYNIRAQFLFDYSASHWRPSASAFPPIRMLDNATGPVVAIQRYTPPDLYPSGANQFQLTDWHREPADYAATGWNYFAPASP